MSLKGISPIIAIFVILLITVVIAGAAWTYISGYYGGMVERGIEVTSIDCTAAGVAIYIHNIGTGKIYTANNDVQISRINVSGSCGGAMSITFDPIELGPGDTGIATDANCNAADDATPRYTIIAGGRVQKAQVTC